MSEPKNGVIMFLNVKIYYNPGHDIFKKIKKSSKARQNRKSLISV